MYIKSFTDYLLLEKKYALHTVKAYKKDIESFKEFCISEFQVSNLKEVNYSEIRSWIVSLSQNEISNRSI
ncbi:MAG: site-specific integrase, partial [Bacteroidia bacterium]|nr:site-specific integrase [Bacteroidia bacterium]